MHPHSSVVLQIPVALAMWNQVGSECEFDPNVYLSYLFTERNAYTQLFFLSAPTLSSIAMFLSSGSSSAP